MAIMPMKYHRAVQVLRRDGIIAYPTEAVWGLGCDPHNPQAVTRLLEIKSRPEAKGLILVAACAEQFEPYFEGLAPELIDKFVASASGITWLVPANSHVPSWIKGEHSSVALRVSTHQQTAALCLAFGGPLVSTSANLAGKPPAHWPWQCHRLYARGLDFIVPGSVAAKGKPSEIRDLISDKVIRPA